ncbi:hypothetical protein [Halorussus litoreus]
MSTATKIVVATVGLSMLLGVGLLTNVWLAA